MPAMNGLHEQVIEFAQPREGNYRFISARFRIWIPPVARLRGLVIHQHGCGRNGIDIADDLHWRDFAGRWDCALLGTHYRHDVENCHDWNQPQRGSEAAMLQALSTFAGRSGHAELVDLPWVLWGHSGGAAWCCSMLGRHHQRIVGAFCRSAPWIGDRITSALPDVPVMLAYGAAERQGNDLFRGIVKENDAQFARLRREGMLLSLSVDPIASHDTRWSRLLAMPFLHCCMGQRLSDQPGDPLKPVDASAAWVGDTQSLEICPADQFAGDRLTAAWLPDETVARAWQEFGRTGWVTDTTAPPVPTDLLADVDYSDGLVTGINLRWRCAPDAQTGIKSFVIYRDGRRIGSYQGPATPHNPDGHFQGLDYGDEPTPARPKMTFTDPAPRANAEQQYQVAMVNWQGLESALSEPLLVSTRTE